MKDIKIMDYLGSVTQGTKISRGMKLNEDTIATLLQQRGWTIKRQVVLSSMKLAGRKKSGHKVDIVASKNGETLVIDVKSSGNSNTHGAPVAFATQFVDACRLQFGKDVKMMWMRITNDVNSIPSVDYADYHVMKNIGIEEVNAHTYFGVDINKLNASKTSSIFNNALIKKIYDVKSSWYGIKPVDIIIHIMKVFGITIEDIKESLNETDI